MHGIRRVVVFCLLTTVVPTVFLMIPLYLRHRYFANILYEVTESESVRITQRISTIFCSEHGVKMNESFNAFQLSHMPEKTAYRKHIRLKKSMELPDDTFQYWGFYLLKGATVNLSVCSRFDGAAILIIKGERKLNLCGLADHNKKKALAKGIYSPGAEKQVKITFETNAQEISSAEEIGKDTTNVSDMSYTSPLKTTNFNRNSKDISNVLYHKTNQPLENGNATARTRHRKSRMAKLSNFGKQTHLDNLKEKDSKFHTSLTKNQELRLKILEKELNNEAEELNNYGMEEGVDNINSRHKRDQKPIIPVLINDQTIKHGGNAINANSEEDSDVSSFETNLLLCFSGNVLKNSEFNSSLECNDVNYLINGTKHPTQASHSITENGYYYYFFYSNNDLVLNKIHAVFDIYKPTLQYENVTNSCINKTECRFPLKMFSTDKVFVEVLTRDGIEHDPDDISILTSVCYPRMGIYIIFPIAVLFFVLSCAFM